MSYTYYPPSFKGHDIDPYRLQHAYYVQLAPDGIHLVPGILQQDEKPKTGRWLQVGYIQRDFPRRYFVQYTDFHTLVPGSLLQASQQPRGKWKEIKKKGVNIHRIKYDSVQYIGYYDIGDTSPEPYVNTADFNNRLINENILTSVFPGVDPNTTIFRYQLYSFYGSFNEFGGDITKLIPFFDPSCPIKLHDYGPSERFDYSYSTEFSNDQEWFEIAVWAPDGNYMLVLGMFNNDNQIVDYITFEDYFNKTTST